MRYINKRDAGHCRNLHEVGNISVTGSVLGMQRLYSWPVGGQVRCGAWVYNVGVAEVERLRGLGLIKGERR